MLSHEPLSQAPSPVVMGDADKARCDYEYMGVATRFIYINSMHYISTCVL